MKITSTGKGEMDFVTRINNFTEKAKLVPYEELEAFADDLKGSMPEHISERLYGAAFDLIRRAEYIDMRGWGYSHKKAVKRQNTVIRSICYNVLRWYTFFTDKDF